MGRRSAWQLAAGLGIVALVALALYLSGLGSLAPRTLLALRRLHPAPLALALVLTLGSACLNGLLWSRLLLHLGYRLSWRQGLAAFLSAGLGGYVVSGAGPMMGCAMALRCHGVPARRAALVTVICNLLGFCGVLIWTPLGLDQFVHGRLGAHLPLIEGHGLAAGLVGLLGLGLAMVGLLYALGRAPGAKSRLARRLWGPDVAGHEGSLRLRLLGGLVCLSAMAWLVSTLALTVLLGALAPGHALRLSDVLGAAALASTIGSLAFFLPSGIGLQDGALVALLAHSTGAPLAACTAAALVVRTLDPLAKAGLLLSLTFGSRAALLPVAACHLAARLSRPYWPSLAARLAAAAPVREVGQPAASTLQA